MIYYYGEREVAKHAGNNLPTTIELPNNIKHLGKLYTKLYEYINRLKIIPKTPSNICTRVYTEYKAFILWSLIYNGTVKVQDLREKIEQQHQGYPPDLNPYTQLFDFASVVINHYVSGEDELLLNIGGTGLK